MHLISAIQYHVYVVALCKNFNHLYIVILFLSSFSFFVVAAAAAATVVVVVCFVLFVPLNGIKKYLA